MNFWEWFGLILFVLPWLITGIVDRVDLWLFITGYTTISEYVWKDWDAWKAGTGKFPWRIIYLPLGVMLSGVGLFIHFVGG